MSYTDTLRCCNAGPCSVCCRPFGRDELRELFLSDTKVAVFGSNEVNFCVTAVLIIRSNRALLIDTKFNKTDPWKIIGYLRQNCITLTDIFISHGDPDYYFGLEEIKAAYPRVIARTTPSVAAHITNTVWNKLIVWADALGDEIPRNVVLPEILTGDSFSFEGLAFYIFGSDRTRISLHCPELGLVLGGPTIVSGNHMFLADMSSQESRERWRNNLLEINSLFPKVVIPGHSNLPLETFDARSIEFSVNYLDKVAEILPETPTSGEFIARMLAVYPNLKSYDVLELSAKVLTGEIEWD